ncbi:potassium channel family protein [Nocardioides coralli]|uniref:potassium channel family protein n=1 Tax=Nocardioides coralli TaxID=2872154 RepID=UPI001CA39757|nr:potassium channel family protein [Nocardioides coralli]QZY27894.1 potassium channel family protein [Nocardioides coralli]
MESESRREAWERRSEWWLMGAALVFVAVFAWPILDPGLDPAIRTACWAVAWLTWVVFAADYAVRVWLSRDRWGFVKSTPFDLLIVVLPFLRPLALLRLLALLGVLNRRAGDALQGRVAYYVLVATSLLLFVASLLVLQAERGRPGATIDDFGDAVWWAMTTMTTVGYGDEFPVTTTGRLVAAGLMLAGIALLGVVTATVASAFIQRVTDSDEEAEAATRADLADLTAQVAALREEVARLRAGGEPAGPAG